MNNFEFRLGSPEWTNFVFNTPPEVALKGHSKRTQYHQFKSAQLNCMVGVQGRNEACSALAIEYLLILGHLKRAKPQPFTTVQEEFGAAIRPDFLIEGVGNYDGRLFVVETKSARFLTRQVHLRLEEYRERFKACGIEYLIWTDKRPLNHSVRHHLINMWAAANRDVTSDERSALLAWIRNNEGVELSAMLNAGFDIDCLYATAWEGEAFFPITLPFDRKTQVATKPFNDFGAIFLQCDNALDSWWSSLLVAE